MSIHDNQQHQQQNTTVRGVRSRGYSAPPRPEEQLISGHNVNNTNDNNTHLSPGQTILQERNQILKSEEKVQNGIFYVIDAVNRRVDHLPKRKLTALKDAKTYDYSIKLHSELTEAKASLKPLMTSLSFRF